MERNPAGPQLLILGRHTGPLSSGAASLRIKLHIYYYEQGLTLCSKKDAF